MAGLLKFITCGSVDDGKSTLIGHILYDAKLLYADQEKALQLDSKVGSRGGAIDYSLLLDGLMAEREQGITIDVAYRYFTTDHRSFIVADTPGHEEYTRNMAVGASFADLAVILVDASLGVLIQTRRHARICELMGIRHFVFAVNKMDLVGYDEKVFRRIEAEIGKLSGELNLKSVRVIPVSATEGDNVTKKSEKIPWYDREPLLTYLEKVDVENTNPEQGFYLPVQRVCRPDHTFRGFQGQIESGTVHTGDEVTVIPGGEKAHVKNILAGDRAVSVAFRGQPVTIQLDREVDVSRGCVLESGSGIRPASLLTVTLLWMDDDVLIGGKNFYVKLGTKRIPGIVTKIHYTIDVNTGEQKAASVLQKNELAVCTVKLSGEIAVDRFQNHRTLGELILIDRVTNRTSACGVVDRIKDSDDARGEKPVSRRMRAEIKGQTPLIAEFLLGVKGVTPELVQKVERRLIESGRHPYLYRPHVGEDYAQTARHLTEAGLIVLLVLEKGVAVNQAMRSENDYYRMDFWEEISTESLTARIRRQSAYVEDTTENGDYYI